VGKPIRPALAERLPSAEAIVAKLGRCAAEPKMDGFRCQVHKDGDEVRVYSRNLEDMTAMFPEIVAGVRAGIRSRAAIFEGEAVAYNPASEEYRPFQETTRRRRKHQVDEMAQELPLRLFVFDLMYLDGENLAQRPYTERRERLVGIVGPSDVLEVTPSIVTADAAELRAFLLDSVQKGLEGIVAKKLDSVYQAGARSFNWVKLKRAQAGQLQDTVDCVILGYIYGRGKRAAFGAGALLVGVYDEENEEFATVTKIGTGLTDEEWREVRARCDRITVEHRPARVNAILIPSVWVEPRVVIEVLADEITRSPVHTAGRRNGEPGYALRFPRLASFRGDDKRPEDATTVREIITMYEQQAALRGRPGEA
jgi:DNA ligase-1